MSAFKFKGVKYRFDFYEQSRSGLQFKEASFQNKIPELTLTFNEDVKPHLQEYEDFIFEPV